MDWIIQENDGRVELESCAPYHANDRQTGDLSLVQIHPDTVP